MADIFRCGAHDLAVGHLAQLHSIVCYQTVAALDQLDGKLTFADAAVAQDQDALAIHLHQHAVPGDAGSQFQIEYTDQAAHQRTGRLVGAQQRYAMLLGQFLHFREGSQFLAAADDNSRRLLTKQLIQCFVAFFGRKAGQKIHLCQTHDLQAQLIKIIVITRQKQTGTVDLGDLHTDLIQFLWRIDNFHTDTVGQRFERDIECAHPCFLLCSLLPCSTAIPPGGHSILSFYYNRMIPKKQYSRSFFFLCRKETCAAVCPCTLFLHFSYFYTDFTFRGFWILHCNSILSDRREPSKHAGCSFCKQSASVPAVCTAGESSF